MRVAIGGGKWFDLDGAVLFEEALAHNGEHWVSCATLTEFDHETLYLTRRGAFLIRYWSTWGGEVCERFERVSQAAAAEWLVDNNHSVSDRLDCLPAGVRREMRALCEGCEV
jgi:hypothetical protein